MTNNNGDNDHNMSGSGNGTEVDFLQGFSSPIKVRNDIRRDAWVLYKDGPIPKGMTRGQWMDQKNGVGPTDEQFAKNSYAIHASLTGNDKLRVNGKFGEHDYMPPHVFVQNIQLSDSQQGMVNNTEGKKAQNSKAFGFRAAKFRQIADEIGVPHDIPTFKKKLEGKNQVYETVGGGGQLCTAQFDNQTRAGNNIPNLQIWEGTELLAVAWHTRDGKRKYDGKSLAEVQAAAVAEYGTGVEVALKSSTNRTMGTAQLEQYDNGASKRWDAQVAGPRERNARFSHLTAVFTQEDPRVLSRNYDVKWLLENEPGNALVRGLLEGKWSENLRVIGSGNGRTSVQFAMEKFPEVTRKLLDEAGIPRAIAEVRPNDHWKLKAVGETLPPVSVPLDKHFDGAPHPDIDVMSSYSPDEIMIAGRDKNGDRTGSQRTLSEYAAQKLRLPDDAAKILKREPNMYSQATEKNAGLYDDRSRKQTASLGVDW
ncbi:VirE2 family protein [Agrobacterium tumefaciens]|uniref:VirE2 family protein n=1 Tax=Agrobacterium tumefaciens TaxID=358 RepID=UPI0022447772|nr:VirE2 family protein [Agrobacterium tumefaciens]MCW8059646.1 VirE2 family protein [Agrobacterium tumefaciens]MCW8146252.1 VirE2 family protein [Agrobacterium tumefaciens]